MREHGKLHMFLIILAGMIISAMLVMMRLGGSVNFQEFMSPGRVYDLAPEDLQKSTAAWSYDRENKGYWLLRKKAIRRFELNEKVQTWNFLYITVERLSTEYVTGLLRYLGKDGTKLYEQPVTLTKGRNVLFLDGSIPIKKLSLVIQDAEGEFISISDMQIRTTPSWFTIPHFLELFAVAFAAVTATLIILSLLIRRLRKGKTGRVAGTLLESMQAGLQAAGNFLGSRISGRLYPRQKESIRKFLFSVLFIWMMTGNAAGWLRDAQEYRYHVLVCAALLLAISFVSWEKPLQNQSWNGPLMKSWIGIWLGMILCDLFIVRKLESVTGYAMLIAGSVFIYFWQNMERPQRMLCNLMEALEITFFLGIIYCMAFRMKRPAVDYNGMFKSPEELAMYAVFMAVVFLAELDRFLDDRIAAAGTGNADVSGGEVFAACMKDITGGAIAVFLVLRSGHALGITVLILLGVLYVPHMVAKIYGMAKKCRIMFLHIMAAAVFAYACVNVVFISTKYFPEILDMNMKYKEEMLLTGLEGENKELFLMQYPGSLHGVKTKEIAKLPIIWRTYARRLNLFGHGGQLWAFKRKVLPYNGYLDMAYHHGIFILLPYIIFQIMVIALGIKCAFRKKGRNNIYMLFLGISYLCFSFGANVEISWGHPFWLCYYLSAGYLGRVESEKSIGKEGSN